MQQTTFSAAVKAFFFFFKKILTLMRREVTCVRGYAHNAYIINYLFGERSGIVAFGVDALAPSAEIANFFLRSLAGKFIVRSFSGS